MILIESAPLVRPASTFAAPPENTYRNRSASSTLRVRQYQGLRECAALLLFFCRFHAPRMESIIVA